MRNALWGYWLILLGIFVVVIMLLVQSITTTSTEDRYLINSIAEASMVDAVDKGYYRTYGELKINKEKFMENFIRRMAEETSLTQTYTIEFVAIYEAPPKVSVRISTKSASFNIDGDKAVYDITNNIDAIIAGKYVKVK